MIYDYQYDIGAIIAAAVLLFIYYLRRSYVTKANHLFVIIITCDLVAALLDALSIFTISNPSDYPVLYNYFVSFGYLYFFNILSVLFFAYIDAITKIKEMRGLSKVIIWGSTIFYTVVIWTSQLTHLVAYFDENMVYQHGPLMPVMYILPFIAFIIEAGMFIYTRKKFNKYQISASMMLLFSMIIGLAIQMVFTKTLICQLLIALILFFVYMAYENPAHFTFKETQCFNRTAFTEKIKSKAWDNNHYAMLGIKISDFEYQRQVYGTKAMDKAVSAFADFLYQNYHNIAYAISDDRFLITFPEDTDLEWHINKVNVFSTMPTEVLGNQISLNFKFVKITDVDNHFPSEMVEQIIEYRLEHVENNMSSYELMKTVLQEENDRKKYVHVIQKALENDSFEVYYQPIYNVESGKFESAEALLRLNDPVHGFINPESLIVAAEKNNYINEIGVVIFEKICSFLATGKLQEQGIKYIELNMSPVQFREDDLVPVFSNIMGKYGIESSLINMEVTETAEIDNEKKVIMNIQKFNEIGISLSIDDYGSGFASAEYLINLPVKIVKIDKSILWKSMEDNDAMIVLKHTIKLLHDLGKKIVVEGVETEEMVSLLKEEKCDLLQGYYYSKPIPPEQFVEFLKKNN